MQDDGQQRLIYLDFAVVLDEAQFSEFIHKKIHARTRGADHARQGLLGNFREDAFWLLLFAVAREEQQCAGEAFLTGVEELVDQVFFHPDIVREHVLDEMVGQLMLGMEHAEQLVFLDDEKGGRCNRCSRGHASRLAGHAALAEEVAGAKHRDHCLLSRVIHHGQFHAAFLDVHDAISGVALRVDRFASPEVCDVPRYSRGIEKDLRVEGVNLSIFSQFLGLHIQVETPSNAVVAPRQFQITGRLLLGLCKRVQSLRLSESVTPDYARENKAALDQNEVPGHAAEKENRASVVAGGVDEVEDGVAAEGWGKGLSGRATGDGATGDGVAGAWIEPFDV